MKNLLILFFTIIGLTLFAQQEAPPQGINYQAVVYSDNGNNQPGLNSPGQVLWNEDIGVQFSILSGSATGTVIYKETHVTSTDEFGMFDLVIGQGLVQGTQSFNMIDWGSGYHFLKVEVDKTGGTNYVEMSNQQLWSVPYALYSGYSSSSGYADSSAYAEIAGNGLTGVVDNGDGTLTFTYYDGSTYTTAVLSGLGGVGPQGPAGADGQDGQDGLSAYEIWISQGNTGTEQDFLNSLEGLQGPAGTNGVDGINGIDGQDGLSAYEIWLTQGNTGTEQDFLNSLQANSNTFNPTFISNISLVNYTGQNTSQTYNTIDVSAYVPASSTHAIINFTAYSQEYYRLDFRTNSSSIGMYEPNHMVILPNLYLREHQFMVPLDSSGTFEYMFYKLAGNTDGTVMIDLVGYY